MGTEGFKGLILLTLMIASLMVLAIAMTTVSAPSTFSASLGAALSPTSARANTKVEFTVTVPNYYTADNIDNVILIASGFTQPTDLKPTTWNLSTITDGVRFDAIGDNVITPGGSETFVFFWTTPNITTQTDYMISVLVSKEEVIYTTYENLGGFMVTIDGKKPTLTINVTQVGVTPPWIVNVVGTTLDNAKATITITSSETLQSIGPVTVENSGWSEENFLPPIPLTTTDNIVYTGTFTVGPWDDNVPVVKVASAKDLAGNENTNMENSFTVDTRAPVFIENGLSTLVSGMRINVVQARTGTIFRYVDNDASKGIIIRVEDNIANADNGKWVTSVTIDTTAATRDPTIDNRWTKTITLSEGLNPIVKVTATDRTGNTRSDNVENIFIDTQPPTIEFNTVAGETWDENGELINDNTPEIKITVLDPGYPTSGLGVAYGNLDVYLNDTDNIDKINSAAPYGSLENKDPWVVPTGVFENVIDNAGKGLVDGTYWIIVRANDNLAHAGDNENWAIAKRSFTIDTSKPIKDVDIVVFDKIGGTFDNPNVYKTAYRIIEGTVTPAEIGGIIKVYFNGVRMAEYDLVATTTSWSIIINLLTGQTTKIEFTLTDKAGNESDKVLYGYAMSDTTAPTVTITAPESGISTDATSIILEATVTKDIWETYAELMVRIDATSLTVPFKATNVLSAEGKLTRAVELVEGTNTISVSVQDLAGNWSTVKTIAVTRTVTPVTPWVTYPVADVYAFGGNGTGHSKSQLKFDISSIPAKSNILSAKLWLYRLAADNWDGEILLNRVDDQLWGENITAIGFDAQTLTNEETQTSKFISPGWDYLDVKNQLSVDHLAGHTYSSYRLGWANDNGGEPSVGIDDGRLLVIESKLDELYIIFSSSEYNGSDPYLEVVYLRPYAVSVSISPTYKSGTPREELSYTVMVANTGNLDDNYVLTISDNAGWGPTVFPTSLAVASGALGEATLNVTLPENVTPYTMDNITVTVTSQNDTSVSDNAWCEAHVEVLRGVEISISPSYQSGSPGENLEYAVTVRNLGNVNDNYDFIAQDNEDWGPMLEDDILEVPAGENRQTTLSVTIPEGADKCTRDNITVTAISQADNAIRDNASCIAHAAPPPGIEWDALITATFSGGSNDAIFGVRADATSGFDSEYDVPEPPAPPDPPYVRAYFYYPEQTPDELHHSCLALENLMEWPLRIEYADNAEDITLTWSVENVPTEYNVLLYRGEDLIADMRAENNYTFEAMSENHDFRVLVGKFWPFTLELTRGWNMISFPVLPEDSSPDSIFGGYYVLYGWDAESKRYLLHADSGSYIEPDPNVKAGVGYWAYVLEDENVSLLGFPVNQLTLSLRLGWNLIGSTYGVSSIADPIDDPDNSVVNWAFTWDANQRRYVMVQLLGPGKGYWVYALKNCSLVLSNLKLVIVYGIGGRGDLSFNDMAYTGGRRAQHELNVELVEMHSMTEANYVPNLRTAAEDPDTVLIVGVGFDLSEALGTVAQEFPDKNFVGIDTYARFLTPEPLPNLMDVVFEEHNGSALVGVLGALLATHYDYPHIGAVLGVEIPVLWKFEIGYKWGCDWAMGWYENNFPDNYAAEPDNSIVITPKKERVLWTYTGTFTDITKGYVAAKPMYAKGAVAVYNIAGPLGLGINLAVKEIAEAENLENGPPFWIGVDADQDWINPGFVIASMMKRVDYGVYYATELVLGNKFRDAVQEYDGTIRLGIGTEVLGIPMEGISISTLDDLDAFLEMGIEAGIIDPENMDAIYAKVKAMREAQPSWVWEAVGELENRIRIDMENVPEVDTREEIDYWRSILG